MLKLALIERLDLANSIHGEMYGREEVEGSEVGEKEMWRPAEP
jgi:hypothetical protein